MFADCRGNSHSSEEAAHDSNVAIVSEILDSVAESQSEYYHENEDYPNGYGYIVQEVSHGWAARFAEWVGINGPNSAAFYDLIEDLVVGGSLEIDLDSINSNLTDNSDPWELRDYIEANFSLPSEDEITRMILDRIDDYDEVEFSHNEYSAYEGSGVCLYSLDLGECEEQIEISAFEELQNLHDQGCLDDVLDDVNCDLYISRSQRRENRGTAEKPHYEDVGRKTYDPYSSKHPDLLGYHSPGGVWYYIVCEDAINEAMWEGLEDYVG